MTKIRTISFGFRTILSVWNLNLPFEQTKPVWNRFCRICQIRNRFGIVFVIFFVYETSINRLGVIFFGYKIGLELVSFSFWTFSTSNEPNVWILNVQNPNVLAGPERLKSEHAENRTRTSNVLILALYYILFRIVVVITVEAVISIVKISQIIFIAGIIKTVDIFGRCILSILRQSSWDRNFFYKAA